MVHRRRTTRPAPVTVRHEPVIPKRPPRILNIQEAASMIQRAWRRHIVSYLENKMWNNSIQSKSFKALAQTISGLLKMNNYH